MGVLVLLSIFDSINSSIQRVKSYFIILFKYLYVCF